MTRFSLFILCLSLFFAIWAKETKIAYVDMERILSEYETAKEAKRELEREIEKYRQQEDSIRQAFAEAKKEFESKKLMLTAEGRLAE